MIIRANSLTSETTTTKDNILTNEKKENLQNTKSTDSSMQNLESAANTIDNKDIDNSNHVKEIKKQIDDGSYKVDTKKTADKMAQDLLVES